MMSLRYFGQLTRLTLGRLCQQRRLLAGLVLLCLLLPLGAGRAAQALLSRGVDFSSVTLAVTAPAGDGTPQLLERYMGEMKDIAQYCQIVSMEEKPALKALQTGEVTAVLILPEDFIRGVMRGEDPDLRLVVGGDRPLESLLLLWVGQSACDILSAFQSGVYAVLELYSQAPPPGLSRDQVVMDINLRYIRLALDRENLFQTEMVSATGALPIPLHYGLALLCYFALSAAPLFVPLYGGDWLAFQRRLRCAGRGILGGYFGSILTVSSALLLLLLPGLAALEGLSPSVLGGALGAAAWCALFCALCCLLTRGAASCGMAAFALGLAALALAGGIVPPVLLPEGLRAASSLSPIGWLMELASGRAGLAAWVHLGISGAGMAVLSLALYKRQVEQGDEV